MLICDDEPVLRILVRATLDRDNYTVIVAKDGHEAVELARSEQPDLIVLDVVMPGRSGHSVLKTLREDAATATIPVIILTAWTQTTDGEALLAAGADRFLTKPFSPHELATLVDELLSDPAAPSLAA